MDSIGFPHKPLFNDSAGTAAFMVIQHAILQKQEKYLPLFQTTGYMTDKYELAPIEDEENVNQRRLKVGLPTIEEGAKELGVDYKPKKKSGS